LVKQGKGVADIECAILCIIRRVSLGEKTVPQSCFLFRITSHNRSYYALDCAKGMLIP
jgi:hypothetical protein